MGKGAAFRFIFGSKALNYLCQSATGYYYSIPMISLFYYCHSRHSVELTYYMIFYYFSGNIVFATVLYILILMVFDRGLHALISLNTELELAEKSRFYNIESYLSSFDPTQIINIYQSDQPANAT